MIWGSRRRCSKALRENLIPVTTQDTWSRIDNRTELLMNTVIPLNLSAK